MTWEAKKRQLGDFLGLHVSDPLLQQALTLGGGNVDAATAIYFQLNEAAPPAAAAAAAAAPEHRDAFSRRPRQQRLDFAAPPPAAAPPRGAGGPAPRSIPAPAAAAAPAPAARAGEPRMSVPSRRQGDDCVVEADDDVDELGPLSRAAAHTSPFQWPKTLPTFQVEATLTAVPSRGGGGVSLDRRPAVVCWLERSASAAGGDALGVVRFGLAAAAARPFCVVASGKIVQAPRSGGGGSAAAAAAYPEPPAALGRLATEHGRCLSPLLAAGLVHLDGIVASAPSSALLRVGCTIVLLLTVSVHADAAPLLSAPGRAAAAPPGQPAGGGGSLPVGGAPPLHAARDSSSPALLFGAVQGRGSAATQQLLANVAERLAEVGVLQLRPGGGGAAVPRDLALRIALFETAYLAVHGSAPQVAGYDGAQMPGGGGSGAASAAAPAKTAQRQLKLGAAATIAAAPPTAAAVDDDAADNADDRVDARTMSILMPEGPRGAPAPRLPLAPQPRRLRIRLRPYQLQGLAWMLSREQGGPPLGEDPSAVAAAAAEAAAPSDRDGGSPAAGGEGGGGGPVGGVDAVLLTLLASASRDGRGGGEEGGGGGGRDGAGDAAKRQPPATANGSGQPATAAVAQLPPGGRPSPADAAALDPEPSPWAALAFSDGTPLFINAFARRAQLAPPARAPLACVGGILSDEMGLGKTAQMIALILATRGRPLDVDGDGDAPLAEGGTDVPPRVRATLVVAPLSVLQQWADEVAKFVDGGCRVLVHYEGGCAKSAAALAAFDVVVTSYHTLAAELAVAAAAVAQGGYGAAPVAGGKRPRDGAVVPPLFAVAWDRVVLDEAHVIRNRTTRIARACCALAARARWALTGTPLQNSLLDIFSLFDFLRHPFGHMGWWRDAISTPFARNDGRGLATLQGALRPIVLRRTKAMRDCDGRFLGDLPPPVITQLRVVLPEKERAFYDALYRGSKEVYARLVAEGRAKTQYFKVLELLLRMRQACDSPALVGGAEAAVAAAAAGALPGAAPPQPRGSRLAVDDEVIVDDDDDADDITVVVEGSRDGVAAAGRAACSAKLTALLQEVLLLTAHNARERAKAAAAGGGGEPLLALDGVAALLGATRGGAAPPAAAEDVIVLSDGDAAATPPRRRSRLRPRPSDGAARSPPSGGDPRAHSRPQPLAEVPSSPLRPPLHRSAHAACAAARGGGGDGSGATPAVTDGGGGVAADADDDDDGPVVDVRRGAAAAAACSALMLMHSTPHPRDSEVRDADASAAAPLPTAAAVEQPASPGGGEAIVAGMRLRGPVKVVIFSHFTEALSLVQAELTRHRVGTARLDGSMSQRSRERAIHNFKTRRDLPVFLLSLGAGSVGLNLTCASIAYLLEPAWNPAVEAQALSRLHRLGQAQTVYVRRLICVDTIEGPILELQARKSQLAADALGAGAQLQDEGPPADDLAMLFDR